jgi:ribonuclease BN (tRNA processing enzyme)
MVGRILIDCGIGTMRRMLEAAVPSQTIETIFIAHNHPDNALGLVDVLAVDYDYLEWCKPMKIKPSGEGEIRTPR